MSLLSLDEDGKISRIAQAKELLLKYEQEHMNIDWTISEESVCIHEICPSKTDPVLLIQKLRELVDRLSALGYSGEEAVQIRRLHA